MYMQVWTYSRLHRCIYACMMYENDRDTLKQHNRSRGKGKEKREIWKRSEKRKGEEKNTEIQLKTKDKGKQRIGGLERREEKM